MATGWLQGVVKEVPSGDQVVVVASNALQGVASHAAALPAEKRITIAAINAPRLGRRDGTTQDEPFAWGSRENLRKTLIGKPVVFKIDYAVESIGREFGTVFVNEKENAAYAQIAGGWARVKETRNANEVSPYAEQFKQAEDRAKQSGLGLWNKKTEAQEASVRNVVAIGKDSGEELISLASATGGVVSAVVEGVGNPHVLRVSMAEASTCTNATVFIAGITCPLWSKRTEGEAAQPEPFSVKAKVMVESMVLNRDVQLKLEGTDKYGNVYASVLVKDPQGNYTVNVGESLLKAGLAKVVDWSANIMSSLGASKLRSEERLAKQGKVAIWHNWQPPTDGGSTLSDTFKGTVVEVVSGDTILVWSSKDKTEKRVQLSSIRAPRQPSKANNNVGEPFALEAKEFLRSRLIGREVSVKMEYTRKIPIGGAAATNESTSNQSQQPSRELSFGTVTIEEKDKGTVKQVNAATMLLVRGLAQAVKHRGDDDRSSVYDDLLEAESQAIKARKNIHGGKKPGAPRINDLSSHGSQAKSKQFLPFLQRSGRVHAVVDYVLSGHRLKLYIAKDSLSLTFSLSSVRCPGKGEPFSEEALRFSRLHCMQRDVDIEVESVDRIGTFLGNLYIHPKGQDLSQLLVSSGLATAQEYKLPPGASVIQAQNHAKKAKLGIWQNYSAEEEAEKADLAASKAHADATRVETIKLRATNIVNGNLFYGQRADDTTSSLLEQVGRLSISSDGPSGNYSAGEIVMCKFSGDGQLYRAKVESFDIPSKQYQVFYMDFGNREKVSASSISPIPLSVKSAAPLAVACRLAFVKSPSLEEDYGVESAEMLHSLIGSGQILAGRVEERTSDIVQGKKPEQILHVALVDPQTNQNISLEMVRNGLARLDRRVAAKQRNGDALETLKEEEEQARKNHVNMWQYGDIGSDDEDGPPRAAWGRK